MIEVYYARLVIQKECSYSLNTIQNSLLEHDVNLFIIK